MFLWRGCWTATAPHPRGFCSKGRNTMALHIHRRRPHRSRQPSRAPRSADLRSAGSSSRNYRTRRYGAHPPAPSLQRSSTPQPPTTPASARTRRTERPSLSRSTRARKRPVIKPQSLISTAQDRRNWVHTRKKPTYAKLGSEAQPTSTATQTGDRRVRKDTDTWHQHLHLDHACNLARCARTPPFTFKLRLTPRPIRRYHPGHGVWGRYSVPRRELSHNNASSSASARASG